MSSEEEDIRLPGDQTPVTTVPTTMGPPVPMVPTMTPALPEYHPLNLGAVGSHVSRTQWKTGGGYQWSMIDSNTQESWLPFHEMGTCPWCIEEEADRGPGELAPAMGLPKIIPKELLDAKFNGTPKKLALFMVQVEKFLQAWGRLFPSKARMVDYIAAQLRGWWWWLTGM
ncbi:UNVERIFIED_CONTAM: hypothetical protein K2H54_073591 [Gekko kuhli]